MEEDWSKYILTDEAVFKGKKNKKQKMGSKNEKYVICVIKPKYKVNA